MSVPIIIAVKNAHIVLIAQSIKIWMEAIDMDHQMQRAYVGTVDG